jgi:hypothetical protein
MEVRDVIAELSRRFQRDMEAKWDNDREAHILLDLINAEFQSDPMSVQCFDLRVVDRVKLCVEKAKRYEKVLGP